MEHRQVVLWLLLPADQEASKAVHPAMRPLHHPASGSVASLLLDGRCFFAPAADMGRVAELLGQRPDFVVVVAFIQAQPLGLLRGRLRPGDRHTLQSLARHLEVVAVRSLHRDAYRDPRPIGQQTAFGAPLGAVGGIGTRFFPRPRAPWSLLRPSLANPTRCLSVHRIRTGPAATSPGTLPPPPTPGSGDGRYCSSRSRWRSRRSTGSPCAAETGSPPWRGDWARASCDTPADAAFQGGSTVRFWPKARPRAARAGGLPFLAWLPPTARDCSRRIRLVFPFYLLG